LVCQPFGGISKKKYLRALQSALGFESAPTKGAADFIKRAKKELKKAKRLKKSSLKRLTSGGKDAKIYVAVMRKRA
jgi:cellobiose-specific phosphotransferase system component IIA